MNLLSQESRPASVYRELPLSKGFVALVDASDFERCSAFKWTARTQYGKDGSLKSIYAIRSFAQEGKRGYQYLHRFILDINDPKQEIDHRDRNGLNCQKANLRLATRVQNMKNSRRKCTYSGYKGVWRNNGGRQWIAGIDVDGKFVNLGSFPKDRLIDAAKAYDAAAIKYFGEFACLNFPHLLASNIPSD